MNSCIFGKEKTDRQRKRSQLDENSARGAACQTEHEQPYQRDQQEYEAGRYPEYEKMRHARQRRREILVAGMRPKCRWVISSTIP
jgi:hypothetical protein